MQGKELPKVSRARLTGRLGASVEILELPNHPSLGLVNVVLTLLVLFCFVKIPILHGERE